MLDFLTDADKTELKDICDTANVIFDRFSAGQRYSTEITAMHGRMLLLQRRFNKLLLAYDEELGERNLYLHMLYMAFNDWVDAIAAEQRANEERHRKFYLQHW